MRCEEARGFAVDFLVEELADEDRIAFEEHLRGCDACSADFEQQRVLWSSMGELPIAQARGALPDAAEILGAYEATGTASSRNGWRVVLAIAASLVLFTSGMATGRWMGQPEAAPASERWAQTYALLIQMPVPRRAPEVPVPALSAVIAEYAAWAARLEREGRLVIAEKLSNDPGRELWREEGALRDAVPPTESRVLGGLYVLHANSYEDAQSVASTCPHLSYGGVVTLRAIEATR